MNMLIMFHSYNYIHTFSHVFTLQDIGKSHRTSEDRLTAMLRKWLKSSPNHTWSELVAALKSAAIERPDIAAVIEDKYIKSDDSSVQESRDTAGE